MTPEPHRYLANEGRQVWDMIWSGRGVETVPGELRELVQVLCEQVDERVRLRATTLRDGAWRDRVGLRNLDLQMVTVIAAINDRMTSGADSLSTSFDDLLAALGDPT